MDGWDLPEPFVIKPLVLVPQHISNADDRFPWSLAVSGYKFGRQCACCFGNDLCGTFDRAAVKIAARVLVEGQRFNDSCNTIDLVTNLQQPGTRILACHHQKTRTASRSTSCLT